MNNWINKINNFRISPTGYLISLIFLLSSTLIAFQSSGLISLGALMILLVIIVFFVSDFFNFLDSFQKLLNRIIEEFDNSNKVITCEHNCKNDISSMFDPLNENLVQISERILKSRSGAEIIYLEKGKFALVSFDYEARKYELYLRGENVNSVKVVTITDARSLNVGTILLKKPTSNTNDNKDIQYFEFQSSVGVNVGIIDLIPDDSERCKNVSIEINYLGNIVTQCELNIF